MVVVININKNDKFDPLLIIV